MWACSRKKLQKVQKNTFLLVARKLKLVRKSRKCKKDARYKNEENELVADPIRPSGESEIAKNRLIRTYFQKFISPFVINIKG